MSAGIEIDLEKPIGNEFFGVGCVSFSRNENGPVSDRIGSAIHGTRGRYFFGYAGLTIEQVRALERDANCPLGGR
jgi:hypothetical protein